VALCFVNDQKKKFNDIIQTTQIFQLHKLIITQLNTRLNINISYVKNSENPKEFKNSKITFIEKCLPI